MRTVVRGVISVTGVFGILWATVHLRKNPSEDGAIILLAETVAIAAATGIAWVGSGLIPEGFRVGRMFRVFLILLLVIPLAYWILKPIAQSAELRWEQCADRYNKTAGQSGDCGVPPSWFLPKCLLR